jgi:hypothetical protein
LVEPDAPPAAHGIETGTTERCEEKSVLVFSVLGILPGPLQDEGKRACDVTDRREWLLSRRKRAGLPWDVSQEQRV